MIEMNRYLYFSCDLFPFYEVNTFPLFIYTYFLTQNSLDEMQSKVNYISVKYTYNW